MPKYKCDSEFLVSTMEKKDGNPEKLAYNPPKILGRLSLQVYYWFCPWSEQLKIWQ